MSAEITSVSKTWGVRCPNCGDDTELNTTIKIHVVLEPNGYDGASSTPVLPDDAFILCDSCGHEAEVQEFRIET